jgi:hypothetical protein
LVGNYNFTITNAVTGASITGSNDNTNSGWAPNRRLRPTTRIGGGRMRPRVIAVPIALVAIIGAASAARLPETD